MICILILLFFLQYLSLFICIYFGGDKYLYTYKTTCYSFRVKMWSLEALLQAKISTQIIFCQNKNLRKNMWLQCSWLSKIFLQTNECQNNSCIIILKRRTVNLSQYLFLMRTFLVFKCCHCTIYIYIFYFVVLSNLDMYLLTVRHVSFPNLSIILYFNFMHVCKYAVTKKCQLVLMTVAIYYIIYLNTCMPCRN